MKKISILFCAILAITMVSCGGSKPETKVINTEDVNLWGKHADYIELVDDSCTVKYNVNESGSWCYPTVTVTFRLKKEVGELKGYEARYGNIDINFVDIDGGTINVDEFSPDLPGYGKLESLLAGKVGDKVKVTFRTFCDNGISIENLDLIHSSAHSFEVNQVDFTEVYEVSSSSYSSDEEEDDDDNEDEEEEGSSEWDSIIDDYESYMDDYIKIMKKANSGDTNALAEAMSMMETAQSLAEKLDKVKGKLSSSQLSRYSSITLKAAQGLL